MAAPNTPVCVLAGDGGFLFTGTELATAVQYELPLAQINTLSAVLLAGGVALIMALMWYSRLREAGKARDLLLPASLAAIGWFFLINKVYSPQYSLWLAVLLALLAAPPALAVAFAAVDVLYFASSFIILNMVVNQNPATGQWSASSLNKDRDPASDAGKFMSDAATAYAVLALSQ